MLTRIFNPLTICLAISIFYIACIFADKIWVAELATHFSLHMTVICFLFVIIFLARQNFIYCLWMMAIMFSLGHNSWQQFSIAKDPTGKEISSIKILQFNVLYYNEKLLNAIPWIISQNADVVILQEVSRERALELRELQKHYSWYQYRVNDQREAFGMAIFTNKPVNSFSYVNIGKNINHYTMTDITVGGARLHIYEIHTQPPVNEYFAELRNSDLEAIGELIAKDKHPHKILIGDLNCTIYSPNFINLAKTANLHHAQRDFNIEGTWPSFLPAFLRIGIDHILASENIKIEKRTVAEYQGSDHMPIITKLALY